MTPADKDTICLPRAQFEALLETSAERGARKALERLGLHDDEAVADIRDLRDLLGVMRLAGKTFITTSVKAVTIAIFALLVLGFGIKMKGGG